MKHALVSVREKNFLSYSRAKNLANCPGPYGLRFVARLPASSDDGFQESQTTG
jgi:hypothetical protein